MKRIFIALSLLSCLLLPLTGESAEPKALKVALLYSPGTSGHEDIAKNIHTDPSRSVELFDIASPFQLGQADAIIAIGTRATLLAIQKREHQPVLALMLPSIAYDQVIKQYPMAKQYLSVVYFDQPLNKQLGFARLLLPGVQRLTVLYSEASLGLLQKLKDTAKHQHLEIRPVLVADRRSMLSNLRDSLEQTDALMVISDPLIYNSQLSKPILLTTLRMQKPVVGAFSEKYVEAGMLGGLVNMPRSFYEPALKWLENLQKAGKNNSPVLLQGQYFEIYINYNVAKNLHISMPDESLLRAFKLGETP